MKVLFLVMITVLMSFAFASVGASHNSPARAFVETYFPCLSLLLTKPTWQTTYFDNSILPPNQQRTSTEEVAEAAQRYILEPPKKPRFIILFLHGLTVKDQIGAYLPFLAQVLAKTPEIASTARIIYPFSPLRAITFSEILDPPISIGRAWFDLFPIGTTVEEFFATKFDRLGLYRATEQIDFMVHSQRCQSSVPTERMIVMGHSLGASASLEWVLSTNRQPAGVIAISGALPRPQDYLIPNAQAFNAVRRRFRTTMIHGTADPIIMFKGAKATAQTAREAITSTGGSFEFIGLEDLDHFPNLTRSPKFYSAINNALVEGFLKGK